MGLFNPELKVAFERTHQPDGDDFFKEPLSQRRIIKELRTFSRPLFTLNGEVSAEALAMFLLCKMLAFIPRKWGKHMFCLLVWEFPPN